MTGTIKAIFTIGLLVIVGLVGYQYYSIWGQLEEKKAEAKALKAQVETTRTNLTKEVDELKAKEARYKNDIIAKQIEIDNKVAEIDALEKKYKSDRDRTLKMSGEQEIADSFKKTYEFNSKDIVVLERPIIDPITNEAIINRKGKVVTEPVLSVPIDYIKEMIDAKLAVVTCEKQKQLQLDVTQLTEDKVQLKEQIIQLKEEKATKFAEAYEEAYKSFSTVHDNYIKLLNSPPKVDLAPSWLQILGGLLGGVVLCGI